MSGDFYLASFSASTWFPPAFPTLATEVNFLVCPIEFGLLSVFLTSLVLHVGMHV